MSEQQAASRRYSLVDHPADVVIHVRGKDLAELFSNAGYGLCDLLCDAQRVSPVEKVAVDLSAHSAEQLMVRWLSELLYQFEVHKRLLPRSEFEVIDRLQLKGYAMGEAYDPARHELHREVKAVTYHGLKIEQFATGWTASILFDL